MVIQGDFRKVIKHCDSTYKTRHSLNVHIVKDKEIIKFIKNIWTQTRSLFDSRIAIVNDTKYKTTKFVFISSFSLNTIFSNSNIMITSNFEGLAENRSIFKYNYRKNNPNLRLILVPCMFDWKFHHKWKNLHVDRRQSRFRPSIVEIFPHDTIRRDLSQKIHSTDWTTARGANFNKFIKFPLYWLFVYADLQKVSIFSYKNRLYEYISCSITICSVAMKSYVRMNSLDRKLYKLLHTWSRGTVFRRWAV